MASLTRDGANAFRLRFLLDKRRCTVGLGEFEESEAIVAQDHIERLINLKRRNRPPHRATLAWLDTIPVELYDRLANLSLVEARSIAEQPRTIIAYMRSYVATRTDWRKPANYKQAIDKLELYLKKDVPLNALRKSDVDQWHRWMMQTLEMSPNTAGQNVKRCRQIMNVALADREIEVNPFQGIRIDLKSDKTKNRFLDEVSSQAILEACPNQEWRVIFALGRFGGLRTPSETLALKWSDIQWDRDRFKVTSSKTERYGKGSRIVPLWPELRAELDALYSLVEPGVKVPVDSFVITKYRETESNLRTELNRIADRAGVEKWPKPFMALRASRRTELERSGKYANHVLNTWFGHTGRIAEEHYLQVTEADFEIATGTNQLKTGTFTGTSIRKQPPSAPISRSTKPNKKRALMALASLLMVLGVHPRGFEPLTLGSEDRCAIQLRHGCIQNPILFDLLLLRKAHCTTFHHPILIQNRELSQKQFLSCPVATTCTLKSNH